MNNTTTVHINKLTAHLKKLGFNRTIDKYETTFYKVIKTDGKYIDSKNPPVKITVQARNQAFKGQDWHIVKVNLNTSSLLYKTNSVWFNASNDTDNIDFLTQTLQEVKNLNANLREV